MTLSRAPLITYYGGILPPDGDAVDVEYENGGILWDDGSGILWDDGSLILWSYVTPTSPDVFFSFSAPRITYAGAAE